jgi:hypothetical protein
MKKMYAILLAVVIVIVVAPYARSSGTPAPPPGVPENGWIPLGDSAGFVIASDDPPGLPRPKAGTIRGYFMVRHLDRWFRVDSSPEVGLHKTTSTP